jgi:hypothetical protein
MNEGMQNLKEIEDLENKLKDRYTITEIISVWAAVYGEDMMTEYPGFIQRLTEQQAASTKQQALDNDSGI